ncbi:GH116 family glycosyl hydrolase [Vibrio gazogenes]|nr:GH116 family glycosyl hydrolase [Vibrio gazogenes]USP15542.1 glycoside hydrolase family 116 protein [Vibrio gazogenes]
MMNNKIPYTSYYGLASELCSQGEAVEFLQPWYKPVSTTPENTGMAVGGIGSTFTLTPKGETPNFSFIPGIYIDCSQEQINFNDFYISVMDDLDVDNLRIHHLEDLERFLTFYPVTVAGVELEIDNESNTLSRIKQGLRGLNFYLENQERFARWQIEFTEKTQRLIHQAPQALETQLWVAMEFFNGLLVNESAEVSSLASRRIADIDVVKSEDIHYQALYPIAQYEYTHFDEVKVRRKVVSPIMKGDEKLCSLPLHWNHFHLENRSGVTKLVTLAQPFDNLIGSTYQKSRQGVQDSSCSLVRNAIQQQHHAAKISDEQQQFIGVSLTSDSPYQSDIEGEVLYGVVANHADLNSGKVTITVKPTLYGSQLDDVLVAALNIGRTNRYFDSGTYTGREPLSALVVVQVELQPGESLDLRFLQVMDHSKIWLDNWHSEKAYSRFFPARDRATLMATEMLSQLESIEERIIRQQIALYDSVAQQMKARESAVSFSTMAMNTLSFLAESTVWDCHDRFLVKECVDYPFFNSLDVYFYGSFAILYLLPRLDGKVMEAFAQAILSEDETPRRYWEYAERPFADVSDDKYLGVRAVYGAVIHDLGSPFDIQPDAYSWHNVKEWKDLAPKFILMVYRHYQETGNHAIIEACWPAVQESINYLSSLIEPGDTLPLVHGTDDTFDNLSSHGVAIYCASLWVAGLQVASQLAQMMGEQQLSSEYQQRADAALETLEQSLWDEQKGYYHFSATPIQVKHLTGQDYQPLQQLGLTLSGDRVADARLLNDYLNRVDQHSEPSRFEQRLDKKQQLLTIAPLAFSQEYHAMAMDSDNSFGDALVADTYLKLMGMDGLFRPDRVNRTLDFIYQTNYLENSPHLGVANMTLADGAPHDAFQAQDVWGGVQFSVASALKLAGKYDQAETLLKTVYDTLYHSAKIPFAAPEGFNGSARVTASDLQMLLPLNEAEANQCLQCLKSVHAMLEDGRVSPTLRAEKAEFMRGFVDKGLDETQVEALYAWLIRQSMKYTAGRYFRPGMIFSYIYR